MENGTLATLPNRWLSTYARLVLASKVLGTGAWPGVNQADGRLENNVSIAPGTEASPYQVLRVANWSAGMLNLGMKFVFYKALPTATYPSVSVPLTLISELYREPIFASQATEPAVAVYSMAWICQLEVMSPKGEVAPPLIVKAGGTTVEVATYVHLSSNVIVVESTLSTTPAASVLAVKAVLMVEVLVVPHAVDFCGQPTIASSILLFVP